MCNNVVDYIDLSEKTLSFVADSTPFSLFKSDRVDKELLQAMENAFRKCRFNQISIPLVKAQKGLISLSAGKVIDQDKDEYVLITTWENQDALVAFCGEAWGKALIPHGMEKYVKQCWVHHFEQSHKA